MGCDIHIVLERKREGSNKWIGVLSSDNYELVGKNMIARERDYGLFGRLAGVRSTPKDGIRFYARNLPRDVSDLAWDCYMSAPTDHHSPSHLTLDEFISAFLAENPDTQRVRPQYAREHLFGVYSDEDAEYRVVFWFDN